MTTYETEVKILVSHFDEIVERLGGLGAECLSERVYERNIRYDSEERTLSARGAVLRLREDETVRLTFKEPGSIERGIITREELEVEVADHAMMDAILAKFGYLPVMLYEKYRTTYHWGDSEITLDDLPYGLFIEVEGTPSDIESILEKLGLQDAERRTVSYAKLFEHVKHHLGLDFRDLTFENFADIDVPESAFISPGSIVIR